MSKPYTSQRPLTRLAMATLVIAAASQLGGCAGMGDSVVSGAFVDPAKYELFDCQQLEAERKSLETRTADLQGLIDKANTGTGGAVVGELAYRNEYISVRASAKLAEETWQRDKCVPTPPKPAAAPPAAHKGARARS